MTRISKDEVANWEIFIWSLNHLGGSDDFVDVEDVFVKCFEIAPRRFSWRTRPDIPDYKKCSKGLRDAEAKLPALLIKTKDGLKRQLTVQGQKWIQANFRRMESLFKGGGIVPEPKKRPRSRLLAEFERSDEFRRWQKEGVVSSEKWRVAELFRCSQDSEQYLWKSRMEVIRSAAHSSGKNGIIRFLREIEQLHPEWFERERNETKKK